MPFPPVCSQCNRVSIKVLFRLNSSPGNVVISAVFLWIKCNLVLNKSKQTVQDCSVDAACHPQWPLCRKTGHYITIFRRCGTAAVCSRFSFFSVGKTTFPRTKKCPKSAGPGGAHEITPGKTRQLAAKPTTEVRSQTTENRRRRRLLRHRCTPRSTKRTHRNT